MQIQTRVTAVKRKGENSVRVTGLESQQKSGRAETETQGP